MKEVIRNLIGQFKIMWSNKLLFPFSIALVCIGFFVGLYFTRYIYIKNCDQSKYRFINLQLSCDGKYVVDKRSYTQLKKRLEKYISEKTNGGKISGVAIYFRDLHYGPTLGIDEHEKFSPASLLKLPLLLTYFNYSQNNPNFLETEIIVPPLKHSLEQIVPPKMSVKEGSRYSINDLLTYMIKYSDNNAYYTLLEYLKQISPSRDLLRDTFVDLGIIDPQTFEEDTLSVKSYASIFVQLYHSSFLQNKGLSDKALSFLADTDFTAGITAGIPQNIQVAHKFGERSNIDNGLNQLHDCGIIYYPNNPYLLCVMTRGSNFEELTEVIKEISKMVYDEFDSRRL